MHAFRFITTVLKLITNCHYHVATINTLVVILYISCSCILTNYLTVASMKSKYHKYSKISTFRGEINLYDTNIYGFAANGNAEMEIKVTMTNPTSALGLIKRTTVAEIFRSSLMRQI